MRRAAAAALLALAAHPARAQLPALDRLPSWTVPALSAPAFAARYAVSERLNPFYVSADFDGDGAADVAVWVRARATGAHGVAVVSERGARTRVLGAGTALGPGGADWRWARLLRAEPRATAGSGVRPRGAVLVVADPAGTSGIVWWDGEAWRWS